MYRSTISPGLEDTDAAGVLFFARFFSLSHRVYESFLEEHGCGLRDLLEEGATILPIVHADCDYSAPLRLGDRVDIVMTVARIGASSFETTYRFECGEAGVCASVRLVHAVRQNADGGKAAIPSALLLALKTLWSDPSA